MRDAVHEMVTQGLTQRAAAQHVGMSEVSLSRALKRPQVSLYLQEQRITFSTDMDELKGLGSKMAINTAMELLRTGSEATKVKMVEFFAGERKKPTQININNTVNSKGYEYARPGQRVVDVIDAEEVDESSQTPAIEGHSTQRPAMQSGTMDPQPIDDDE